jgi:hypothetical protein
MMTVERELQGLYVEPPPPLLGVGELYASTIITR